MTASNSSGFCEQSSTTLSHRVISEIAEREQRDFTELPPLYSAIDPDVLTSLVQTGGDELTATFSYLGYEVAVHGDGQVSVSDSEN